MDVVFSAMPPSFPEMVSFLVGLILMGRLSLSDSPLLLVILVLVDMFVFYNEVHEFLSQLLKIVIVSNFAPASRS